MHEHYTALLLDFYGTLVEEDSAIIAQIAAQVAQHSALHPDAHAVGTRWWDIMRDMVLTSHGTAFRPQREIELDSLTMLLDEFKADLDPFALSQPIFDYWQHPRPYDGARELLHMTQVPVCLVSNIDDADLRAAMLHLSWQAPLIVTSQTCRAYKPRVEMFEAALQMLGVSAGNVLHVGDSVGSDVEGALRAGVDVAWVNRHGRELAQTRPTYVISSLDEVIPLLAK